MPDVLIVQNARIEGPGLLGRLLREDGFGVDVIHAKRQGIPRGRYAMGVILGAPESANDDLPYLGEEMDLIRRFAREGTPLLGVCLGSQLVAKAFGARVYRGPRSEIGFFDDLHVAGSDPLLSGFGDPFTVFHWHGDTFDLPEGAVRLARSGLYANQAFRIGTTVGLQFHLEVDRDMIRLWLDAATESIPHSQSDAILQDMEQKMPALESNMRMFYRNFKSEFYP